MERDIRNLFNENEYSKIEISKNHRIEFLQKLTHHNKKQHSFQIRNIFKIAASLVIILVCAVYYFNSNNQDEKISLQIQVAEIEKEYLINIEKEWESFKAVAEDSILVHKYKLKMLDFDKTEI